VTPRQAAIVVLAFVLGGVAAVTAERLTRDLGTNPSSETIARVDATIESPTGAPVAVQAQVVRLPEGFEQRRTPDGSTLNLVQTGRVEIETGGRTATYLPGTSFVAPAGEPYVIRVVETAEISVVDLRPDGS
jgi:quercetin dioxygenase-like cupin family protein